MLFVRSCYYPTWCRSCLAIRWSCSRTTNLQAEPQRQTAIQDRSIAETAISDQTDRRLVSILPINEDRWVAPHSRHSNLRSYNTSANVTRATLAAAATPAIFESLRQARLTAIIGCITTFPV